jgi:hypothetical protein
MTGFLCHAGQTSMTCPRMRNLYLPLLNSGVRPSRSLARHVCWSDPKDDAGHLEIDMSVSILENA